MQTTLIGLRALEGIRSPFLDTLMGLITRLGEETVVIVVLCAIYWCISKRTAYIIGISYFISALTVQGMKICFRVDRPWIIDPTLNPVSSAMEHATGYSFPSGHTQSATALFGALGLQLKPLYLKIICFSLAVLVAFTRMYLGVHTILDVTVSLLLTLLIVVVTAKLLARDDALPAEGNSDKQHGGDADKSGDANQRSKTRELVLPLATALFALVVIAIAAALYSSGTITQAYVTDCLKVAGASFGIAVGMYVERVYINFSVKTKNIAMQLLKYALGLAGVMLIKEGLKPIIGISLPADTIRYFLMSIWMTLAYPLIIKRFFSERAV